MSYTVTYRINSGKPPFRVWLLGSGLPLQLQAQLGTYTFFPVEEGNYTLRILDAEDCLFELPVIVESTFEIEFIDHICDQEQGVTTTTTTSEEYPCNYPINYYGYQFEKLLSIHLGTSTGAVLFDFNTFYIPVKFILEFDGVEVINTGYRGNAIFQAVLNLALTDLGEPLETINTDSNATLVFEKTTATEYAVLKVYTPLDGSIATFKVRCPVDIVYTWDAEFNDHVCIIEDEPTTTTSTSSTTTTTSSTTTTSTTVEPASTTTTTVEPATTTTTTECVRPGGLDLNYRMVTDWTEDGTEYDITSMTVQQACDNFYNVLKDAYINLMISFIQVETDVFDIGSTLWLGHDQTICIVAPDGNYWFSSTYPEGSTIGDYQALDSITVVTVVDGIITAMTECTTTTSTTEEPTTTTTTSP